jgi:hypothetical protein
VYQVIAEPSTMTVSLKVPGLTDWTDIPMGDFFRNR